MATTSGLNSMSVVSSIAVPSDFWVWTFEINAPCRVGAFLTSVTVKMIGSPPFMSGVKQPLILTRSSLGRI